MFSPSRVIINGKFKDNNDSLFVSIFSPSFQYGLNVFEGIRVYSIKNNYHPFLIDKHINRLIQSAKLLYIEEIPDKNTIKEDIKLLINSKSDFQDYYLKYLLCYLDEGSWSRHDKPDRVCFLYPVESIFREKTLKSCNASITSIQRINQNSMPPKIKCGANYINSRLGYLEVNKRGQNNLPIMPIFLDNRGYISESSGSCIFVIKDKSISTPPLKSSILPSITRSLIINIIQDKFNEYEISEKDIDRWDLHNADSLFLVGTNIEICFIKTLDHTSYNLELDINYEIFNEFKKKVIDE